jgi:hypothetical protein
VAAEPVAVVHADAVYVRPKDYAPKMRSEIRKKKQNSKYRLYKPMQPSLRTTPSMDKLPPCLTPPACLTSVKTQ